MISYLMYISKTQQCLKSDQRNIMLRLVQSVSTLKKEDKKMMLFADFYFSA